MKDDGERESSVEPRKVTIHDRRKVRLSEAPPDGEAAPAAAAPESRGGDAQSAPPGGAELERARTEAAGYLDDLKRLKAEFENYRKRVMREQTDLVERASSRLVARLLPVLDNFELAVAAAEDTRDFQRMLKGVEMVFGELREVLIQEGLEEITARGERFDPNVHEAALEVPGDATGEPVVDEVLRAGYTFKGRMLRPAMVKVARRAAAGSAAAADDTEAVED